MKKTQVFWDYRGIYDYPLFEGVAVFTIPIFFHLKKITCQRSLDVDPSIEVAGGIPAMVVGIKPVIATSGSYNPLIHIPFTSR